MRPEDRERLEIIADSIDAKAKELEDEVRYWGLMSPGGPRDQAKSEAFREAARMVRNWQPQDH